MRIAFVWTGVTSYMADCWRRLSAEPDVEVKVWIDTSSVIARSVAFDIEKVMHGVTYEISGMAGDFGSGIIDAALPGGVDEVVAWKPDFLFVVGWRSAVCRAVVEDARLKDVPKVCCFDMPWRWQLRCLAAPFVLWRFLRKYRAAFVPGAVCARYAKWLGFKKIYKGLFAIDVEKFHCSPSTFTYFLYIGRDSGEKRLDDLREAHQLYRERGGNLPLRMYGKGLEGGFVKPEDVPVLMHGAAAFVLASEFDPWPLVLLEAMAAGCPVIASDKCTNRPELGKNWRVFKCGDVEALAREMLDIGRVEVERGRKENLELARQYDCGEWVNRVKTIIKEVAK